MADIATMERALRNADAAGDAEAARTIAQAIKAEMSKQPAPAADKPSGFAMAMTDPIHGGAQLLTNILPKGVVDAGNKFNNWLAERTGLVAKVPEGGVDQMVRQREAEYQAARGPDAGFDWARLGGAVVNPVNLALGAAAAPAAGASLLARLGAGAYSGGVSSALAPATSDKSFAEEKQRQLMLGLGIGAAAPAVGAGVSRVISPKASTDPALQMLKSEGVRPTVGQSLGGAFNAVEEKLQSLPIMGDMIRNARSKANEQFNQAAVNRALELIGAKVTGAGSDTVRRAGDLISKAYDDAKQQLGHFSLDRRAASELVNLRNMAQQLPDKERRAFESLWSKLDGEVSPNGSIVAEGFKRFDSAVGKDAATFAGSTDAYQRQLGEALKELQRIVVDAAKRNNPTAARALDKADEAYANLVRVEGAATRSANNGGVFTPAQLGIAVRQSDKSVRDRATARGEALMQDLATAGQSVLGNKVPNSGTFDRAAMGMGGLGAGFLDPTIPVALTAGAAAYTAPVQQLLSALVSSRPQAAQQIAGLLNQASPMLAPAGGLLGAQLLGR